MFGCFSFVSFIVCFALSGSTCYTYYTFAFVLFHSIFFHSPDTTVKHEYLNKNTYIMCRCLYAHSRLWSCSWSEYLKIFPTQIKDHLVCCMIFLCFCEYVCDSFARCGVWFILLAVFHGFRGSVIVRIYFISHICIYIIYLYIYICTYI